MRFTMPRDRYQEPIRRFDSAAMLAVCLAATTLLGPRVCAADASPANKGQQVYLEKCASCHGKAGEGTVDDYPRPLLGEKSIGQLVKFIAKRMPDDDPGTCVGEEAEKVADYIYNAFYSKTAQERNRPARIEVSRLTVRQYRHAVADLVGSFRGESPAWGDKRGLRGEYFKSRRFRDGDRLIDRLDPTIEFDFGEQGPDPEKFEPAQFSIRWQGSVQAPDTGDYEFIVRTEHATRLWVNGEKTPLIDAWVKSGNDNEYRGSIYLIGGRVYPLKLEFSKAKQGVDDSKDKKKVPPPVKASIGLFWKRPHRAVEVITERHLTPEHFPEVCVVATHFPADDRSIGYERGTSISKAWDQATTDAAIEVAGYVLAHKRDLADAEGDTPQRAERLKKFCRQFAERAFRRPLSDELARLIIDRQFENAPDPETAANRVVLFVMKSPRFLYRELTSGRPDGYEVAARLSFGLWDSLPDAKLLEAATKGELATREQVTQQAERMVADPRTRQKVHEFLLGWLKVEQVPDLSKDKERYPEFNETVASDLRTSLELFLDDVVWSDASDFRQLLLADSVYLNGRLAQLYGAELAPDAPFQKVYLESNERAGVLSHPYLMATFAYTSTTSPIHRGVFLSRSVLGRPLRPPPEAFAPLAPELHPSLTTRERVTLQTSPQACQTCHASINPLGFGMENFDAIGRYRSKEKDRPIDATGVYEAPGGGAAQFAGARQLATYLAGSEETHRAFVEQLFHNLVKQPARAYGEHEIDTLRQSFARNEFNIRKLIVEILASTALEPRQAPPDSLAEKRAAEPKNEAAGEPKDKDKDAAKRKDNVSEHSERSPRGVEPDAPDR